VQIEDDEHQNTCAVAVFDFYTNADDADALFVRSFFPRQSGRQNAVSWFICVRRFDFWANRYT